MSVVVEFCGLPGAGKSTIARALVAALRLRAVPTTEVMAPLGPSAHRPERLRRKTVVIARGLTRAGGVGVAANVASRSGQADARDRVARPANLLVVREAVRRAKLRPGVHVLDQGPIQEWWSAALRADADRVLAWAATDRAPRADLVVRVDTPVEVLAARLARRRARQRQSRLEAVDGPELGRELAHGARLLDLLCDEWSTAGVAMVRVDGSEPGAVASVEDALARLG